MLELWRLLVDEVEVDLVGAPDGEGVDLVGSMPKAQASQSALVFWLPVH
jgi:hypothetical protein